jgi:hypothetical protein
LDTVDWIAKLVWEYIDSCEVFASAMGNHQTTPGRTHLINYGLSFRPNPSITHINDQGNVLANIYFEDSVASYRAYAHDIPLTLDRPEIT